MRLKRSEYETLKNDLSITKEIVISHSNDLKLLEIKSDLAEYWLEIVRGRYEPYSLLSIWYDIKDCWETIKHIASLESFYPRFNGYKDGIRDGDIFVECDCEEQPKKVLNSKKK